MFINFKSLDCYPVPNYSVIFDGLFNWVIITFPHSVRWLDGGGRRDDQGMVSAEEICWLT